MIDIDREKADFEEWIKRDAFNIGHLSMARHYAWDAWQARATTAPAPAAPEGQAVDRDNLARVIAHLEKIRDESTQFSIRATARDALLDAYEVAAVPRLAAVAGEDARLEAAAKIAMDGPLMTSAGEYLYLNDNCKAMALMIASRIRGLKTGDVPKLKRADGEAR